MKIGEVVRLTGIPASAIRYYETQGIIQAPGREGNGYRSYTSSAVEKLLMIRDSQRLGFTLETIRNLFLNDGSCSMSLTLEQIRLRLLELERIESGLKAQRTELIKLQKVLEDGLNKREIPPFEACYRISP